MKYKVHCIDANDKNILDRLENFLNQLSGEVVAVLPNLKPTFQMMGATAKLDSVLIVEKLD